MDKLRTNVKTNNQAFMLAAGATALGVGYYLYTHNPKHSAQEKAEQGIEKASEKVQSMADSAKVAAKDMEIKGKQKINQK